MIKMNLRLNLYQFHSIFVHLSHSTIFEIFQDLVGLNEFNVFTTLTKLFE
jgi:hypothetical protein